MILQSTDDLEEYIGNKYSLVIVAAKRARQLKEGHSATARDTSDNKLSIALREIEEQKIQSIAPPEEELAPAPRDVIASLVAGAEFDLDDDMDLEDSDAVDDLAALLVGTDEEEEDSDVDTEEHGLVSTAETEEDEEEGLEGDEDDADGGDESDEDDGGDEEE